jgi:PadR family transcriptional regulator, regulatory protein PadR
MPDAKLDLMQGTLDIMVLQTLDVLGALHGYGIARRIEQLSGNEILLNQGTIYASLVRLQHRGWIVARWGVSDSNRKEAKDPEGSRAVGTPVRCDGSGARRW